MRPKRKEQTKRLNIEIGEAAYERLKVLEEQLGASSSTEVLRRALSVFDVLVSAVRAGETLILRRDGGEREVLLIE